MKQTPDGAKRRLLAGLAVTAALLVPLAVFGAPALARSTAAASEYEYSGGSSQYQYRVQICHHTGSRKHPSHTITVSSRSVPAHLRHGDTLGPCGSNVSAPTVHNNSGNDDDQGNDNGNGHGHGHGNGK
jgi:hypothetical protein